MLVTEEMTHSDPLLRPDNSLLERETPSPDDVNALIEEGAGAPERQDRRIICKLRDAKLLDCVDAKHWVVRLRSSSGR